MSLLYGGNAGQVHVSKAKERKRFKHIYAMQSYTPVQEVTTSQCLVLGYFSVIAGPKIAEKFWNVSSLSNYGGKVSGNRWLTQLGVFAANDGRLVGWIRSLYTISVYGMVAVLVLKPKCTTVHRPTVSTVYVTRPAPISPCSINDIANNNIIELVRGCAVTRRQRAQSGRKHNRLSSDICGPTVESSVLLHNLSSSIHGSAILYTVLVHLTRVAVIRMV